jgi:Sucrose hydrolase-like, C-terminal domain
VAVDPKSDNSGLLVDVFDENHSRSGNGTHQLTLGPYGHRWYRIGAPDNALNRTSF